MKKHITILISPTGEEFYEAYGPMTKDRSKATEFSTNPETTKAPWRFGRHGRSFWECERTSELKAREEYKNWTYRIEPI